MDPSYIYFKEINIDQDKSFTADFSKENEIEEVLFNKENEYGVTGFSINSILADEKLLKVENVKEQKRISEEIQELIKNYKEPDLTFVISNPKTKTIKIPFPKKNESDLPKLKLTYFNTTTKRNEDFLMYYYIGHLKKFGFEWVQNALDFKFAIKIDNKKKKKLSKNTRKNISTDHSRVWNMLPSWQPNGSINDKSRLSFLVGYIFEEKKLKDFFKITNSYDFTTLTPIKKKLSEITKKHKEV